MITVFLLGLQPWWQY